MSRKGEDTSIIRRYFNYRKTLQCCFYFLLLQRPCRRVDLSGWYFIIKRNGKFLKYTQQSGFDDILIVFKLTDSRFIRRIEAEICEIIGGLVQNISTGRSFFFNAHLLSI